MAKLPLACMCICARWGQLSRSAGAIRLFYPFAIVPHSVEGLSEDDGSPSLGRKQIGFEVVRKSVAIVHSKACQGRLETGKKLFSP
ncbi:unnamed protein product [Protopolystoma xenopodis]|uniref:Uncharacterized protein n=1 Tax=Protopolystoma xenopodis TaxID=117903 RepID=A0A3S5B0Q2_9PLAT|nr:unnamed protein product [Protopolystoma xenopodis]